LKLKQPQLYAFVGVSVLFTILLFSQISGASGVAFTLQAQEIVDHDTLIPYPDTWCFTKHQATVIDTNGKRTSITYDSSDSSGNPFFIPASLISDTDGQADKIQVDIKVRCNTQLNFGVVDFWTGETVIDDTKINSLPLTAQGTFEVKTFSQNKNGEYVNTTTQSVEGKSATLSDGKEITIGRAFIDVNEINGKLTAGEYNSLQKIQVTGLIGLNPSTDINNVDSVWVYIIPTEEQSLTNSQVSWVKLKMRATEQIPIPVEDPTPRDTCEKAGGTYNATTKLCTIVKNTSNNEDDESKDDVDYGFLNYKLLSNCVDAISNGGDMVCLDDPKLSVIYAGMGALALLGIFQAHQTSRVVSLGRN
jgi:hypothetical protein